MNDTILTVSEVNQYLKNLIDRDLLLGDLCVRGELSNYKSYPSGHRYFSLKDDGGVLRGVMFKSDAQRLRFTPENGMKVLITGRVAVYPRDGQYQLYANTMVPDGMGELYVAFEQLKSKLSAKGYFAQERKRPLPAYPETICIITSSAGAAIHDMLHILNRRWPAAKVNLLPVRVQGEEAPGEIAEAIRYANKYHLGEFIITGRGGGSMEDLWAFNDERVADAIYRSQLPVISAVGHEPDVTISDFVADLRAATPSNAAELAVPDASEVYAQLRSYEASLQNAMTGKLSLLRSRWEAQAAKNVLVSPDGFLREQRQRLLSAEMSICASLDRQLLARKGELARAAAGLEAMSPLKVLARGYAVATDELGHAVRSADKLKHGDRLTLRLAKGKVKVRVEKRTPKQTAPPPPEQLTFD